MFLRAKPLPQAEAPTEPTGETGGPLAVDEVEKCGMKNAECGIEGRVQSTLRLYDCRERRPGVPGKRELAM